MAVDIFPCEDKHAQERRLFPEVLQTVRANQLWIADRNMCTVDFLGGIDERQSAFVIREHQNPPWKALNELRQVATSEAREWWEQAIKITYAGTQLNLRRIVLKLFQPTRHEETEIVVLMNLPVTVTVAEIVSQLCKSEA